MKEDVLVHVVRDLLEVRVVLLAQLEDGHFLVLAKGLHELLVEGLAAFLAKGKTQALVVEGHRHERAVDIGEHLVLVVRPLREAREELVHAVALGVVDVRAVLVNENPGVVGVVVGVTSDVVATLEDGDAKPAGLGKATGADRPRVSRADDEHVIRIGVEASGEPTCDTHTDPLESPAEAHRRRAPTTTYTARTRARQIF